MYFYATLPLISLIKLNGVLQGLNSRISKDKD